MGVIDPCPRCGTDVRVLIVDEGVVQRALPCGDLVIPFVTGFGTPYQRTVLGEAPVKRERARESVAA